MIRDLEDVLLRVTDPSSRDFMRESVRCYHAGAYRAAVVMAVAAGMDDLRRKISNLASSGSPSDAITQAAASIEKAFQEQKPFERAAIEAAAKGVGLVSPSEQKKLQLLLDVRNLNAHPSGHLSSAEEARHAITSIVDIVLSRPGMLGAVAAREIVKRIPKGNFYPGLRTPQESFEVVSKEIESISPSIMGMLAAEVSDRLLERLRVRRERGEPARTSWLLDSEGSPGDIECYAMFLGGMLRSQGAPETAVVRQLPRIIVEEEAACEACWIISISPQVLRLLDPLDRKRAVSMVSGRVDHDNNARILIDEWVRLHMLNQT